MPSSVVQTLLLPPEVMRPARIGVLKFTEIQRLIECEQKKKQLHFYVHKPLAGTTLTQEKTTDRSRPRHCLYI